MYTSYFNHKSAQCCKLLNILVIIVIYTNKLYLI